MWQTDEVVKCDNQYWAYAVEFEVICENTIVQCDDFVVCILQYIGIVNSDRRVRSSWYYLFLGWNICMFFYDKSLRQSGMFIYDHPVITVLLLCVLGITICGSKRLGE